MTTLFDKVTSAILDQSSPVTHYVSSMVVAKTFVEFKADHISDELVFLDHVMDFLVMLSKS